MLSRTDVAARYTLTGDRVASPGKFEGEPWYVVALWDLVLDGAADGETWDGPDNDDLTAWFRVDDEMRAACGLDGSHSWIAVWERGDGFVCHELSTEGPK